MNPMRVPVNQTGGPTAVELIQQSFNPAVAVLAAPDVDIVCSKNRLTFVELLQPFSRLSVEGQVRDPNNTLHSVNNFRLSVRDISWKPASAVLARRLLSDAVSNYNNVENKVTITGGSDVIDINPSTPWYDSWKETLWGCLEWTEHDFTRHYLGTLLVVSSSHPNPMEQFQQLNNQLTQLMANNGMNDGPRWFNSMSVRYFVLLHDALEGDASKAEEIFQSMRSHYGTHGCHLLSINSNKPKRTASSDSGLPAPDPWLRFLPRKNSKTDISLEADSMSDAVDNGSNDLPSKITTDVTDQTSKIPLMDALQDAMQEINLQSILPPSASTLALSLLASDQSTSNTVVNQRTAVEITVDPLNATSPASPVKFTIGSNESDVPLLGLDSKNSEAELHGACLTADDLERIQSLINEFCLKALLPHMERQMRTLNEITSSRKSTSRSILSATKRWFGSARPGSQPTQTTAISYHPESGQLQIRRLGDLAFLLGMYPFAYAAYHTAKKDFEADEAWSHYAGALEMAALAVFFQTGNSTQNRSVPFHYFETALKYYLDTCKMVQWATRCAVIASECLKATNQYSEAAGHLIRLISEDADLRSAVLLEQAALCFLRAAIKPGQNDTARPSALPWVRKFAFHMILAGHRFGKSGQKRHASRAYQLASQVYCGHGWSLAEDHIYYTVGRQCLSNQQIEAACRAFGALLKPGSMQTAAQQTAYLNEFIHVNQLLAKQNRETKPILPLPVVDSNRIKVLVEARDTVESEPGITEAANVTFDDDEAHHSKWGTMEEKLILRAEKPLPMIFRPTNVLFTETTDNTCQPQSFRDELISLEVPLSNPLRIPIHLSDIRLMWHFSGDDGTLSSLTAAVDNPLVTAYAAPSIILNPSSSNKVILHIKPQAEGQLTIEGISFTLRPANADPTTPGATIPSMNGRVMFSVRGPRLNTNPNEKQNVVYAPDKRLLIKVGPRMPRLNVSFQSLPDFLLSGEIRPVRVELSSCSPNLPIGKILVATNDPRVVALELPVEKEDDQLVIYRWDPVLKSTKMWIRGAKEGDLIFVDLLFFYDSPRIDPKAYRLLRHCCKIVVSSSLSLSAWFQQVPSVQDQSPTMSLQVQLQNLRDVDDVALSGIEIKQVSLLSDKWEIRPELCFVPDGLLHPQESVYCVLVATLPSGGKATQSIVLQDNRGPTVNFDAEPHSSLVRRLRKTPEDLLFVLTWTATQASEDGCGPVLVHGQHYILKSIQETASLVTQPGNEASYFVTYSMKFDPVIYHDFTEHKICIVPVVLYLHSCSDKEILVNYFANYDAGKSPKSTQVYMPEAASPLLWLGRVEGQVVVKHTSEPVRLSVAITRPGVYSLAQGLQVDARITEDGVKVTSPKLEFTLIVNQKGV